MKKLILTSAGFENQKIAKLFFDMIGKSPSQIKVIFVPVAAIDEESRAVLPKCMNDLTGNGIPDENIFVYNLDVPLNFDEMKKYDAIYFCGGNTKHLMKSINRQKGFRKILEEFIAVGGVFVGVSAGSMIACHNLLNGLHYANCRIWVHEKQGDSAGTVKLNILKNIRISDCQALVIDGTNSYILE